MSNFTSWTLADSESGSHTDSWAITSGDLGIKTDEPFSVSKRTLRTGLSAGVEIIEVNNGRLSYSILPTRGMGIWSGSYRGHRLGWNSPVKGPVHPSHVNPMSLGGIGWLAGLDEWIVRCGLGYNGAPGKDVLLDNNGNPQEMMLPLHGQIANLPAHKVAVSINLNPPHEIDITGVVDEGFLFFPRLRLSATIRTRHCANSLTIHDEVSNLGSQPAEFELLYHCNFGPPILGPKSRFEAPLKLVAPRDPTAAKAIASYSLMGKPTSGFVEQVYFCDLLADGKTNDTMAMLMNPDKGLACALRFNKRQMPWFTLWKNTGDDRDGYVTGLEPGTDFPNSRCFEREKQRLKTLAAGASHKIELGIEVADTAIGIAAFQREIEELQGQSTTTIYSQPNRDLSPS